MPQINQDLWAYAELSGWPPKVGDVIHKDGIFNRWIAIVCEVNGDILKIRKAGNPRIMAYNDYAEEKINFRKIRSSSGTGAYYVISSGTYYV